MRLRELRRQRLLSQAELARLSGVGEVTINRIERGHVEPRLSTLRRLAIALQVSPEELLAEGGEGKAAA